MKTYILHTLKNKKQVSIGKVIEEKYSLPSMKPFSKEGVLPIISWVAISVVILFFVISL